MIPPPASNEQAFFQVAATLIPVLLLGGVLLERLQPPPGPLTRHSVSLFGAILIGGVLVIWGEATAITALIRGSSVKLERIFVALVLVLGMVLVLAAVIGPWLQRIPSGSFVVALPALGVV